MIGESSSCNIRDRNEAVAVIGRCDERLSSSIIGDPYGETRGHRMVWQGC